MSASDRPIEVDANESAAPDERGADFQREVLERIFHNAPLMINFVGADGEIKLVNAEWERTLGWTLAELAATKTDIFAESYPDPKKRQFVLDFLNQTSGEWAEFRTRVRDGRTIDTSWAAVQLSDGTRIGVGIDISARKQSEARLRQSQRQLAEAQRLAHVGSWEWDIESGRLYWSDEIFSIFGLDARLVTPGIEAYLGAVHPADRDFVAARIAAAQNTKQRQDYKYRIVRPSGEVRIVDSRGDVSVDEEGSLTRIAGMIQDVTEAEQMKEELERSNTLLRALSARLRSAREEEGTRISREIHDELGSSLTSLRWDLEMMERLCSDPARAPSVDVIGETSRRMARLVDTTLGTVRRIAAELRPSILDDLGLAEAIEWEAGQFEARTGIHCRFQSTLEGTDLNREQSTALFRIFQEALTNILRHARATEVEITLESAADFKVSLVVADNGIGIDEQGKFGPDSLGILGMRERAHLIGGVVGITSGEGKGTGTRVRVTVPQDRI